MAYEAMFATNNQIVWPSHWAMPHGPRELSTVQLFRSAGGS
jgi:hypothetical protein